MFRLLLMNILFLLAALAHSSGADSNCVLGNIPFGSAESHIEPSGVRLNIKATRKNTILLVYLGLKWIGLTTRQIKLKLKNIVSNEI